MGFCKINMRWWDGGKETISIHALRMLSDPWQWCGRPVWSISIHALRMLSDPDMICGDFYRDDFNPRSAYAERRVGNDPEKRCELISIHAPRMQSDHKSIHGYRRRTFQSTLRVCRATHRTFQSHQLTQFQSTLRVCRATLTLLRKAQRHCISIHAPRMQSDSKFNQITVRIFQHFH